MEYVPKTYYTKPEMVGAILFDGTYKCFTAIHEVWPSIRGKLHRFYSPLDKGKRRYNLIYYDDEKPLPKAITASKGDWVVMFSNGELRFYSLEQFEEKFSLQPDKHH